MSNSIITAVVTAFYDKTTRMPKKDVNGKTTVLLNVLSGNLPTNAGVISGTIAESAGLNIGGTYTLLVAQGKERVVDGETRASYRYTVLADTATAIAAEAAKQVFANYGGYGGSSGIKLPAPTSEPATGMV